MNDLLPFMWMSWLDSAEGNRDRRLSFYVDDNGSIAVRAKGEHSSPPDARLLAVGIRSFAVQNGHVPPALLQRLADMFDPPEGHKGAVAKLSRPRGGRRQKHDWIAIGRHAHERIEPGCKVDAVIFETAQTFSCDERTVRRSLKSYRSGIQYVD
ncbi:MAG: hypothetical protein H0W39_03260 [Sphingomonas sp.]|nr:hypothetical protein [Sphingomonas sp.]